MSLPSDIIRHQEIVLSQGLGRVNRTRKQSLLGELECPASGRYFLLSTGKAGIDRKYGGSGKPLPPYPRRLTISLLHKRPQGHEN